MTEGFLYKGDPTSKATKRVHVGITDAGSGLVSFTFFGSADVLSQEAPPTGDPREGYGVFGKRAAVGPWERFSRQGSLVTAWTGDTYILVELPR